MNKPIIPDEITFLKLIRGVENKFLERLSNIPILSHYEGLSTPHCMKAIKRIEHFVYFV